MIKDLFGDVPLKHVPMMPDEYKGKIGEGCGYTKSKPRTWTRDEIIWIENMRDEGYSNDEIALSTGRTSVSIQIKLKRLSKRNDTYNQNHLIEKYALNRDFANLIKPQTTLDLYCGVKSFWKSNGLGGVVLTNDKEQMYEADFHEKAEMLIHKLYYNGCRYDMIDLDPYGSAFECFDLAIKMANKGLVITFGEMGHKRWKRLDFVSRYYGISNLQDFTLSNLVSCVEKIANRNKKHLVPIYSRSWERISRVWFKIEPLKITEQWS